MTMKRFLTSLVLALLCIISLAGTPKYIFYFIGDGMSINSVTATEMYNAAVAGEYAPRPLNFSVFPYRSFISTYSENNMVTDSAAAGSALSCGHKCPSYSLCMSNGECFESLWRQLRREGWGAAVVTTVGINHATPSAFYANAENRREYHKILNQLIYEDRIDFAAGGGFIVEKGSKGRHWIEKAREAGWNVLVGDELTEDACKAPKTMYLWSPSKKQMPYVIDNETDIQLADMTRAAIANMQCNHSEAFCIMIEGGRIDYGAHARDAATTIREVNAMADAVDVAMAFYEKHPDETLIVVTADHETGGVIIGGGESSQQRMELLQWQTVSKNTLTKRLSALRKKDKPEWEEAKAIISDALGLWKHIPMDEKQEAELRKEFEESFIQGDSSMDVNLYSSDEQLASLSIEILDKMAGVFFTHSSHSSGAVPVYAIGAGAELFSTAKDNTQLPQLMYSLIKK